MALEVPYPHIAKANGDPARLVRLPRVRVAQIVMDYLAFGWSAEEICRQHPHLMLSEVFAAMAYYFDNQAEIDAEIDEELNEADLGLELAQNSPLRRRLRDKSLL